jgi:hypothetical protein
MTGTLFEPQRRLAKSLQEPGGVRIGAALSEAERGVESLRELTLAAVDVMINELGEGLAGKDESGLAQAYVRSAEIMSLAGTFGLTHLSGAADSLASLLSAWSERAPVKEGAGLEAYTPLFWDAACVHADALKTLRQPGLPDGACGEIVQGLRRVAKRAQPVQPAPVASERKFSA